MNIPCSNMSCKRTFAIPEEYTVQAITGQLKLICPYCGMVINSHARDREFWEVLANERYKFIEQLRRRINGYKGRLKQLTAGK